MISGAISLIIPALTVSPSTSDDILIAGEKIILSSKLEAVYI